MSLSDSLSGLIGRQPKSVPAADRISLVLVAPEGATLDAIRKYARLGDTVEIGGLEAVIEAACNGSAMDRLTEAQRQLELVDTCPVNQIALEGEPVNRTTEESSGVATHAHIDDLVKEVAAEPVFLTVVFKLPNAQAAGALVEQLPFREKVLGTEAVVFGLTTGNAMEDEPCAS